MYCITSEITIALITLGWRKGVAAPLSRYSLHAGTHDEGGRGEEEEEEAKKCEREREK